MQLWSLDASGTRSDAADLAMAGLVARLGSADFGAHGLAELNLVLPAATWSVYRLLDGAPPTLLASGAYRHPDTTLDCFHAYRAGLYQRDTTFAAAAERARDGTPVLLHCRADEIPPVHRERIYRRHQVRERLSVAAPHITGGLLAVNLYRHDHQPGFADRDIAQVQGIARTLIACVQRHAAAVPAASGATPTVQRLRQRCPALTERELQVCERLLRGWTQDGVAVDLGLSAATVKTYRDRAFGRLGIRYKSELFALLLPAG